MSSANLKVADAGTISDEWATIDETDSQSGDGTLACPESAEWATLKDLGPESDEVPVTCSDCAEHATINGNDLKLSEVAMTSTDQQTRIRSNRPEIAQLSVGAREWSPVLDSGYEAFKRSFDWALAFVLLVLSAPVILLSAVLMRLNSAGPWIYAQKRLGLNGRVFTIYKIRTMYEDSERYSGPTWCVPDDPRITPVGRVLRACHIDELPQLINVLKGEMSLVGPRPERPEFLPQLERALPRYRERLAVRPGLTGLAQLRQPPDTDIASVRRKLNYDLCYIDEMCVWLDVRLLIGTGLKCLGVSFNAIGRCLQLPDPNAGNGRESRSSGDDIASSVARATS